MDIDVENHNVMQQFRLKLCSVHGSISTSSRSLSRMALQIRRPIQVLGCVQQDGKELVANFDEYIDIENIVFARLSKRDLGTRVLLGVYQSKERTSCGADAALDQVSQAVTEKLMSEIDKIAGHAVLHNKMIKRSVGSKKLRICKFGALLPDKVVITMPEINGIPGIAMTVCTHAWGHADVYISLTLEVVGYLRKLACTLTGSSPTKKRPREDPNLDDAVVEEDTL